MLFRAGREDSWSFFSSAEQQQHKRKNGVSFFSQYDLVFKLLFIDSPLYIVGFVILESDAIVNISSVSLPYPSIILFNSKPFSSSRESVDWEAIKHVETAKIKTETAVIEPISIHIVEWSVVVVGLAVGENVGWCVACSVGVNDGAHVGENVGCWVGFVVNLKDGLNVGECVGREGLDPIIGNQSKAALQLKVGPQSFNTTVW